MSVLTEVWHRILKISWGPLYRRSLTEVCGRIDLSPSSDYYIISPFFPFFSVQCLETDSSYAIYISSTSLVMLGRRRFLFSLESSSVVQCLFRCFEVFHVLRMTKPT